MISVRDISKSYGSNLIFEHVSFEVEKGDAVVVIGPSGCGKSTFLRCLNRMELPQKGEILVNGVNILARGADVDALRSQMGMVYQSFNLFSHKNVLENVIMAPMLVHHLPRAQAIAEAMGYLELVGMTDRAFHMPDQLSGGQKQRVAIARCLAMKPQVILFDEPTSALDPTMVDEVLSVIRRLIADGMTCVIVTHEMAFARNVANKVIYMDEKGIYESGPVSQIFDDPQRPKTRAFIHKLKTFERTVDQAHCNLYAFMDDIREYCSQYGFTGRQLNAVNVLYEELVMPAIQSRPDMTLNLTIRSNVNGDYKDVVLVNPDGADFLADLDPISLALVKGFTHDFTARRDENGFTVQTMV